MSERPRSSTSILGVALVSFLIHFVIAAAYVTHASQAFASSSEPNAPISSEHLSQFILEFGGLVALAAVAEYLGISMGVGMGKAHVFHKRTWRFEFILGSFLATAATFISTTFLIFLLSVLPWAPESLWTESLRSPWLLVAWYMMSAVICLVFYLFGVLGESQSLSEYTYEE